MSFIEWIRGRPAGGAMSALLDERVGLECIRREMAHVLRDCRCQRAAAVLDFVRKARDPMDLWLVRADAFQVLAQELGESTAAERMDALTPLFRGWVPPGAVTRRPAGSPLPAR